MHEGKIRNIFGITSRKPTKDKEVDEFLTEIWNRFRTLPFALRWVLDKYEEKKAHQYIEFLIKRRNIHAYPILVEGNGKTVAQAEHTFIPLDSSVDIITL